jgi:hypothetical protein
LGRLEIEEGPQRLSVEENSRLGQTRCPYPPAFGRNGQSANLDFGGFRGRDRLTRAQVQLDEVRPSEVSLTVSRLGRVSFMCRNVEDIVL